MVPYIGCLTVPPYRPPSRYPHSAGLLVIRLSVEYETTHGLRLLHYSDVIMGAMASQITSLTIVYSAVCSGADQRKHQRPASLVFVWGIHRWPVNSPRPAQMASNAENVSIWWRHHGTHGINFERLQLQNTKFPRCYLLAVTHLDFSFYHFPCKLYHKWHRPILISIICQSAQRNSIYIHMWHNITRDYYR